jgi:hypothetical protein
MVLYNCEKCFKQFKQKSNYETHLNRKNPCKKIKNPNESKMNPNESKMNPNESKMNPNESKINPTEFNQNNIIKKEYKCTYCTKFFSSNSNLYKHLKNICKIKKLDDSEKESIYQHLLNEHLNIKNENENIKKELIEIKNKLSKGSTVNNNINNGTINNIQIVAHGKEDLSKIKEDVVLQLVKRGWRSIPMFTKYLHCNDKFPEQKNIYINDINRKYCMVYDGNEWLLKDKTKTIDELYQTKYDFLEENFNAYYDKLENYQQKSFQKFIKLHKEDAPFVRKIKEELKTLLYNKRNKILNNS